MKKLIALIAAVSAALALSAVPALAGDTTTTFELDNSALGGLRISTEPASASLGTAATSDGTLSAQLGGITVTDERGALDASWTASVVSTNFTTGGGTADETIAATEVDYWSGPATDSTGVVTPVPGQLDASLAVPIDTSQTAMSATVATGNNSISWNPTVVINIPTDAVTGTYSGTVTHSVG